MLPAGPSPKALTAGAVATTLRDHLLGFLAANNLGGWEQEVLAPPLPGTVAEIIYQIQSCSRHRPDSLKRYAKRIKKYSNKGIAHYQCLNLVVAAMGYSSWDDACRYPGNGDWIHNFTTL